MIATRKALPSALFFVKSAHGRGLEKSTRMPRKCHRQVVDLVRVCLVFGLPIIHLDLMRRIVIFSGFPSLAFGPLALAMLAGGCSRPIAVPGDSAAAQADPHKTPFHESGTKLDNSRAEPPTPSRTDADNRLPFHEGENVPAGTLISVRLKTPISVEDPDASDAFDAVVVEPVVIAGDTLIPPGILVSGRVESARTSQVKRNRGYVRLKLASVHIGSLDVPVQTASLFARQAPLTDDSSRTIRVEQGRRLTFALAEPVYIVSQRAPLTH